MPRVPFLLLQEVLNVLFKLFPVTSLIGLFQEIRSIPPPAALEQPAEEEGSDQHEEGDVEEKPGALEQLKSKYPTLIQDLQQRVLPGTQLGFTSPTAVFYDLAHVFQLMMIEDHKDVIMRVLCLDYISFLCVEFFLDSTR